MKQHTTSSRHKTRLMDSKLLGLSTGRGVGEVVDKLTPVTMMTAEDDMIMENVFEKILKEEEKTDKGTFAAAVADMENTPIIDKNEVTDGKLQQQSVTEQATRFWRRNKQDIRAFLRWKMMQKMTNKESTRLEKNCNIGLCADSVTHSREDEVQVVDPSATNSTSSNTSNRILV